MPNIVNQELVKAVSINLCYNNIAITNLNVEEKETKFLFKTYKKDYVVISFDKDMNDDQCNRYLENIKGKIVKKFCGSESAANLSFNTEFFPFNLNKGKLKAYEGKYKFSVPIEEGVIFNLKCLLANGLTADVTEDLGKEFGEEYAENNISNEEFAKGSHLCRIGFHDKDLQGCFVESFASKVEDYKNSPDDFLEIDGNSVYIKNNIFDDLEFIKDIQKDDACSITHDFQNTKRDVGNLKGAMIDFINRKSGVSICALHLTPDSGVIPMTQDGRESLRVLNKSEVDKINRAFKMDMLRYVEKDYLPEEFSDGTYTIDFSNLEISFSVVSGTMQSSVIGKDHKLYVDPGRVQAIQSPTKQTLAPPIEPDKDSGLGFSPEIPGSSSESHRFFRNEQQLRGMDSEMLMNFFGTPDSTVKGPSAQKASGRLVK